MYKLLNIIRKSDIMNSNLLQCDTLAAVLLLAAEVYWAVGPPLACWLNTIKNVTFFTLRVYL